MTKIHGADMLIGNLILLQFDLIRSWIGLLEAEKIKFVNIDQITPNLCVKSTIRMNFRPQEVPASDKFTLLMQCSKLLYFSSPGTS